MTRLRPVPAARAALTACAVLLVSGSVLAQQRALTIDAIYDPEQRVDFSGQTPSGLTWLSDTRYLLRERDSADRATRLLSVHADTGAAEPLLDVEELETALAALPGMSDAAARRAVRAGRFVWDRDHTAVVMNISNTRQGVALGVAAAAGAGRKIDGHAGARAAAVAVCDAAARTAAVGG